MVQRVSPSEDEVRNALEVLIAADFGVIVRVLQREPKLASGFFDRMRRAMDSLGDEDVLTPTRSSASGPGPTTAEIVDDLRVALGAKLVAYIARVSDARTVREWAEATRRPTSATEERLRLAHRVATLIGQSEVDAVVPTWFQGMNPHLADRSPARVLHEDPFEEAGSRVLAAASAFVGE
ncbi:hypothetical protein [Microbacterium murale]|uniref:Antitoxin Xre/MbcA/ParS-like toxin-binding domain-containing protein n=1 Tax=Microbacterium murale TaxID=1081040 RepID=A0ABQ1RR24_9MICO|nr:hypothetical protein [Microbacterium murale]GGD76749.1 hypothetical protein GCM10007269_19630 [Microbacterium murale]